MKAKLLSLSIILILFLSSCDKNDEVVNHYRIFIPTAFSPDKNNINDAFRPYGVGLADVKSFKMIITDENGKQLFATESYIEGWKGKKGNGDPYPNGFYYYDMWFSYSDKTQERVIGTVEVTLNGW
jgi:gliding motility-associated-like protein